MPGNQMDPELVNLLMRGPRKQKTGIVSATQPLPALFERAESRGAPSKAALLAFVCLPLSASFCGALGGALRFRGYVPGALACAYLSKW